MNFKEFLYKEDPDVVGGIQGDLSGPAFNDPNSITFALFNNFYLYSDLPHMAHGDLFTFYCQKSFKNKEYNLQTIGEINPSDKEKLQDLCYKRIDRTPMLNGMPWVIQGRMWKDHKIISFWNDIVYLAHSKNDILDFIKNMNENPENYQYEIKNKLISYKDFISGNYKGGEIDISKLHTMSPEQKGETLKKLGVRAKTPRPISFINQLRQENLIK